MSAALLACSGTGHSEEVARRSDVSVPLAFQGVERVQVLCLVQGENGVAPAAERDILCDTIVEEATRASPVPVAAIMLGDPQVLAPASLTILAHGSITGARDQRLLALAMRPYSVTAGQSDILFGAPPQVVRLGDKAALQAAVGEALNHILPWRQGQAAARPVAN